MNKALSLTRILLAVSGLFFAIEARAKVNPVSGVSVIAALSDARELAGSRPDLKVMRVEGTSMLPYFGNGAVLVVKTLPSEKLRAGMVVVYKNRFNETVAHRLEASASTEGWIARGYNNRESDSTAVTKDNLLGVVYATFHSDGAAADPVMLASLTTGTTIALAAPAR